jgi:hypothetical protein
MFEIVFLAFSKQEITVVNYTYQNAFIASRCSIVYKVEHNDDI